MKPRKTWHTLSEDTLQRAAAAWVWMNTYMEERGRGLLDGVRIGDAMLSKLAPPCAILKHNIEGGQIFDSMGNRSWAVIGWPLKEISDGGVQCYLFGRVRLRRSNG